MHDCPDCAQACDCDGEDHWNAAASETCIHDCSEDRDADAYDDEDDGPCIGAACVNPHPYHRRSECETAEMHEAEERDHATTGYWARRRRFQPLYLYRPGNRPHRAWDREARHGRRVEAARQFPMEPTRAGRARLLRHDRLVEFPF